MQDAKKDYFTFKLNEKGIYEVNYNNMILFMTKKDFSDFKKNHSSEK